MGLLDGLRDTQQLLNGYYRALKHIGKCNGTL